MYSTYYSIPTILDYCYIVMTCELSAACVISQRKLLALLQQTVADPWYILHGVRDVFASGKNKRNLFTESYHIYDEKAVRKINLFVCVLDELSK